MPGQSKICRLCEAAFNRYPLSLPARTMCRLTTSPSCSRPGGTIDAVLRPVPQGLRRYHAAPLEMAVRRARAAGTVPELRSPNSSVRRRSATRCSAAATGPGAVPACPIVAGPAGRLRSASISVARRWSGTTDRPESSALPMARPRRQDLVRVTMTPAERRQRDRSLEKRRPLGAAAPARCRSHHSQRQARQIPHHLHWRRRHGDVRPECQQRQQPVHPDGAAQLSLPTQAVIDGEHMSDTTTDASRDFAEQAWVEVDFMPDPGYQLLFDGLHAQRGTGPPVPVRARSLQRQAARSERSSKDRRHFGDDLADYNPTHRVCRTASSMASSPALDLRPDWSRAPTATSGSAALDLAADAINRLQHIPEQVRLPDHHPGVPRRRLLGFRGQPPRPGPATSNWSIASSTARPRSTSSRG